MHRLIFCHLNFENIQNFNIFNFQLKWRSKLFGAHLQQINIMGQSIFRDYLYSFQRSKHQNGRRELPYEVKKTHFRVLRACGACGSKKPYHTFIWDRRRFQRGMTHPHTPTHGQAAHHKMIFIYSMIKILTFFKIHTNHVTNHLELILL